MFFYRCIICCKEGNVEYMIILTFISEDYNSDLKLDYDRNAKI